MASPDILRAFNTILGAQYSAAEVTTLIDSFDDKKFESNAFKKDYGFYYNFVQKLTTIRGETNGTITFLNGSDSNKVNTNPHGRGTYGVVYKSLSKDRIYKISTINATSAGPVEPIIGYEIRTLLLEVFIQCALSTDKKHGTNICKIRRVYKIDMPDPKMYRLVIQMEPLPITFGNAVLGRMQRLDNTKLMPIMINLIDVLADFESTYKFHHRDLHMGNIMFRASNPLVPVLIDFGMSCITLNGVMYNSRSDQCTSRDIHLLITNILDTQSLNPYPQTISILSQALALKNSNTNLYKELQAAKLHRMNQVSDPSVRAAIENTPLFHYMYPTNLFNSIEAQIGETIIAQKGPLKYNDFNSLRTLFKSQVPQDFSKPRAPTAVAIVQPNAVAINMQPKMLVQPQAQPKMFVQPQAQPNAVAINMRLVQPQAQPNAVAINMPKNVLTTGQPVKLLNSPAPVEMKSRKSARKQKGGQMTSQQFFDPDVLPPSTMFGAPSTAPTNAEIRPVLLSTFKADPVQVGGKKKTRRARGGFAPSVMGGFVANAQAAIVPLALYLVYHTMVPKKGSAVGGKKTRKQNRK